MQKIIERKKKPSHLPRASFQRKSKRKGHISFLKPEASPALKNILAKIGKPHPTPFVPDEFQVRALEAIKKTDCLVIAPTGSGKTWIAREAILTVIKKADVPGMPRR